VCRTDLYVARGQIDSADPVVLGHEFAGTIDAVGRDVKELRPGQRVAVRPVLGCGACRVCKDGDEINCPRRTMLGVDHDGAFAEFISVPARCVVPIRGLSWQAAAYAEPVAAALAVGEVWTYQDRRVLILGRNRFAVLLERLMRAPGCCEVTMYDPSQRDPEPPDDHFNMVIETALTADTVPRMIRAARAGGKLILKSRQPVPISFEALPAILKRLTFFAVNYGLFTRAVQILAEGAVDLTGLLGPVYPLEAFAEVFDLAESSESAKLFFDPSGEHVRNHR
jgi:threonine dehydrogenase-like Zn-dependent dehydrogenase